MLTSSVLVLPGRRRWSWWVLGATLVVIATYLAAGYTYGPIFLAASVAIYAVAGRASLRGCVAAVLLGTAVLVLSELPRTATTGAWDELLPLAGTAALWLIIPAWWATARERLRQTRLTIAERHQREHGEQRLVLAREVHDVVAHNLAVIGIQAGAGLRVFDRDPEQARAALRTIHHTNRQALAELRATVDLLRGDGPVDRSPVPGLSGLDDLLEAARASGVDTRLEISGVPVIVAPLVERTASCGSSLVDDQPLIRAGLRTMLGCEDDLDIVGEAADGAAALRLIRSERPDVVLLDIRMPGMNGIDVLHARDRGSGWRFMRLCTSSIGR